MASMGHLYLQNGLPELALERYQTALTEPKPVSLRRAVEALELLTNASEWKRAVILARRIGDSQTYQAEIASETADRKVLSRLHRQRR